MLSPAGPTDSPPNFFDTPVPGRSRFTVRYTGDGIRSIEANTLAAALMADVRLLQEAAKAVKPDAKVNVRVYPPEEGSFEMTVEVIGLAAYLASLLGLRGLDLATGATLFFVELHRFKRFVGDRFARVEAAEEPGKVIVTNYAGDHATFDQRVFNIYTTAPGAENALRAKSKAIRKDDSVTGYEIDSPVIRQALGEPLRVERRDFEPMQGEADISAENTRVTLRERVAVVPVTLGAEGEKKWDVYLDGHKVSARAHRATMNEQPLYDLLRSGAVSWTYGDRLVVDVEVKQMQDLAHGAWINRSFDILRVHEWQKRERQLGAFDSLEPQGPQDAP